MLKKIIPAVAVAAAMLLPAAPAAAWEQVCMKLPLWKTWFALESFHVAYEFDPSIGRPTGYHVHEEVEGSRHNPAAGNIRGPYIAVNQSKCVDISGLAEGTEMMIYIAVSGVTKYRVCETHPANPDWWYVQSDRPYRTLWYEAWGSTANPKCKFTYESN